VKKVIENVSGQNSAGQIRRIEQTPVSAGKQVSSAKMFEEILQKEKLKFSLHAQERLQKRNIEISPQDMEKIVSAVNKVSEKGAKDSLLVLSNLALVVSVENRTVITAVDEEHMKENIFTNIDSAVII
jgi:flagellar operon protein